MPVTDLRMKPAELRRIRDRLGLTQAAFAEELGLHANSLARMERGEMTIGRTVERLARLLMEQAEASEATVSTVTEIRDLDRHNERVSLALFQSFSPELLEVIEAAVGLCKTFAHSYGQNWSGADDARDIDYCMRQLDAANEEELKAMLKERPRPKGTQGDLLGRVQDALDREWARWVRGLLLLFLGRSFLFAVLDLMRLRLTASTIHLRNLAETIGLLAVMRDDPGVAETWTSIQNDDDGKRFHRRYNQRITTEAEAFNLRGAHEFGSESAAHVRWASVAPGVRYGESEQRGRRFQEMKLAHQEGDPDRPQFVLLQVLYLLRTQERVFRALIDVLPEANDPVLIEQRVPAFGRAVDDLWKKFFRAFPEDAKRWKEQAS